MATNIAYTAAQSQATDAPQRAQGYITFPADTIVHADFIVIATGFLPRYVCFENVTDSIKVEWYEGMTADNSVKTVLNGTRSLETTNQGISVTAAGFKVSQNETLAVIVESKVCAWIARG